MEWDEVELIKFFKEILNNIKFWESKQIIHGNIHPENI